MMTAFDTSRRYFKVVMLGDTMTGKTSLAKRYFMDHFAENERPTLCAAFDSKIFTVNDVEYQMDVWDTTGEEKYRSICKLYYRKANVAILCYDVTLSATFNTLNYWMKELSQVEPGCRLYICATKSDLLGKFEANPKLSFAESYACEHGAKFFLTSSKTGENVTKVFEEILEDYIANMQNTPDSTGSIRLPNKIQLYKTRSKKCCSK